MHICFVTTGDIKSIATAKRALGLAAPLVEIGWNVSIIMESTEENKKRVALECNNDRIRVFYYNHCNVIQEIRIKNKIIKRIAPDYIYLCAFVFRNLVCVFNKKIVKLVEHSELVSSFRVGNKKNLEKFLEILSIIYADGLLYASKYLQQYYNKKMLNKILKKPGLYFPYAYNENICVNIDLTLVNKFKCKLKIKEDEIIFVFLGSIATNFGAYLMVDAIKEVLRRGKFKVKLFMLGEGKVFKQLKEYVLNDSTLRNAVVLPGYVQEEEISLYFSIADCFILPMNNTVQDWARCPSKLYMYLPYDKPVITCKVGEPYEVLKESGIYYECGNFNECLELLHSAISGYGIKYVERALPSMIEAMEQICRGDYRVDVNPLKHTWQQRAVDFSNWLTELNLKKQ